jgi:ferredoxin
MTLTYMKNGETLALDEAACTGCGACLLVCPHAVFSVQGKKALIERRSSCMECGACALNCPAGALSVKTGVGCAAAIILGRLTGKEPTCGGGEAGTSCGSKNGGCC